MRRAFAFAGRNMKEILRDPLSMGFLLGFPLAVLFLLTAIQANIPVPQFEVEHLTPGILVFGLSFLSLFTGQLIAKDRETSLVARLCASPLTAGQFIAGYTVPLVPLALGQVVITLGAAVALGLPLTFRVLLLLLAQLPAMVLFIGIGMLAGTALTDKQVGGICGALLTNACAWLSGAWFDLDLVGGAFQRIAYGLPFAHATDAGRAVLAGNHSAVWLHLGWVLGYGVLLLGAAILLFGRKMKNAAL